MSHYKPYPESRESGNKLIGMIPKDWEVKRLRHIAIFNNSNVDKKSYEDQVDVRLCNYTDVYYNEFITPDLEFMNATASGSEIDKFRLSEGDVIITKDSEDPIDIGIPALVKQDMQDVVCGYHLTVIKSHETDLSGFIHRSIQSHPTKAHFFVESPGITRYGLDQDAIGDIAVCVPPKEHRVTIVGVINAETTRIDTLITKKTRFIELLKEKRQALITHAVTKGLNPDVKMKDSSVEWIGEVPEHWSVQPIKYLARIGNGSTPNKSENAFWENGIFPWLTSGCVNQENVENAQEYVTDKALRDCHLPIIEPPAVLVGITGQGKTRGMATTLKIEATINQHIAYLKPKSHLLQINFLRSFLDASYDWLRFESQGAGSTKGAITCEQLANMKIALPPEMEQRSILDHLDDQMDGLAQLIIATKRSIELLKERRSAFITAAVTGQIDLRGAPA